MPIDDDILQADIISPADEQRTIAPLQQDGQVAFDQERTTPAAPAKEEAAEAPADPRAARMEALAERTRENATAELQTEQDSLKPIAERVDPAAAARQAEIDDPMMTIKVRGENVQMKRSEVIARAQKVDAADTYLSEARQMLEDAKRQRNDPQPAQAAEPTPVAVPKPSRVDQFIEGIQLGEDPATIRELLDQEITERARAAVADARNEELQTQTSASYDNEIDQGFNQVHKDFPEVASDAITASIVSSFADGLKGEAISRFLSGKAIEGYQFAPADQNTIAAFAAAGITAEGIKRYKPHEVDALFRDMSLKGYDLPRPAAIIQVAGRTVVEKLRGSTTTPAVTTTTPAPLDRSGRKQAIQQPTLASIPRKTDGTFAPKSEAERATQSRNDMKAERRAGQSRT